MVSTHITFICDNISVVSKIIEGNYPDYEQVIPKKNTDTVNMNKQEMMNLLKRAHYFTADDNRRIHIRGDKETLYVKAQASGFGEFEESLKVKANTNTFEIAFNSDYFLQILKHLEGESLTLEMTGAEKAAIIKEGTNSLFLLMPMKVTNEE